jgi:hypothetical protein
VTAAEPPEPDLEFCCQPGDFTVTRIHTGYLIGRALDHEGPGPWWEYIAIVKTYAEAYAHAQRLAAEAGKTAWLHIHGDEYSPLQAPAD